MKAYVVLAACTLIFASTVAQTPARTTANMTAHQAVVRARTAHCEDDYRSLANFYTQRGHQFSEAAQQQYEAVIYARTHGGGKSYPQSADRARMLEDYYVKRSKESEAMADLFTKKADAARKD